MQAIMMHRFGEGADVADLVDLPEPPAPSAGQAVAEVLYSPINPADLLFFQGKYGAKPPPLPAPCGGEALGRITAVGPGVETVQPGDLVLTMLGGRGSWRQRLTLNATQLFALPPAADPRQLAMLAVNPATAQQMLDRFVTLRPGDWVIQNAANSGVGTAVIALARAMGVKTVNVVRRAELGDELRARGADVVLVDGDGLEDRVLAATGGARPLLAIDAVAGAATARLGNCLADGGVIVNYGLLSGEAARVDARDLVFRRVSLRGYWLVEWRMAATRAETVDTYTNLANRIIDGTLNVEVEAVYPLSRAREAFAHAARGGRGGKILLSPAGLE